jgi:hypothetical protein
MTLDGVMHYSLAQTAKSKLNVRVQKFQDGINFISEDAKKLYYNPPLK